ncbi:MAG: hypothetical protein LBB10_01905 [Bifidobacteriaceae bacterium]|jgi:hypothetical protein|nr:hypothetical protein [Bifidobacteriaceae bacterium]
MKKIIIFIVGLHDITDDQLVSYVKTSPKRIPLSKRSFLDEHSLEFLCILFLVIVELGAFNKISLLIHLLFILYIFFEILINTKYKVFNRFIKDFITSFILSVIVIYAPVIYLEFHFIYFICQYVFVYILFFLFFRYLLRKRIFKKRKKFQVVIDSFSLGVSSSFNYMVIYFILKYNFPETYNFINQNEYFISSVCLILSTLILVISYMSIVGYIIEKRTGINWYRATTFRNQMSKNDYNRNCKTK